MSDPFLFQTPKVIKGRSDFFGMLDYIYYIMDFHTTLQQIQQTSQTALTYLSQCSNVEKVGTITAISVASYLVGSVRLFKL